MFSGPPDTNTLVMRTLARARVQDVGGDPVGCRAHGMLSPGPYAVDLVWGVGKGSQSRVFPCQKTPFVAYIDEFSSLFGARVLSRDTGCALAY